MLDPDPARSKALGSGLVPDPAGSNISGSGVDPDPAGSKNSGSGAPLVTGAFSFPSLSFHSLSWSRHLLCPISPLPFPPLEVGPLNPARGSVASR